MTYMNKEDTILRLFHIGGRGPFGPAEVLLKMGKDMTITLFEASMGDLSEYDNFIKEYKDKYGVDLFVVQRCISNTVGKKEFHVTLMPTCSSLYKVSPYAAHWTHVWILKWGHMCTICDSILMDTTTIDELYTNQEIQMPNFLSIDAQGAEYDILEGSLKALEGDLVGVVTEVEFSPIYDGQKLFSDQDSFLRKYQFNICDIVNTERWHPGPAIDVGHLMAGEALYLRNYQYFVNRDKTPTKLLSNLSKLAITSYYFSRTSYVFQIMEYIMENLKDEWNIFIDTYDNRYLHTLVELYNKIKTQTLSTTMIHDHVPIGII